jgi:D-cysteine desulfhydrase
LSKEDDDSERETDLFPAHFIQGLLDGLHAGVRSQDVVSMVNAKGQGYAISTKEELQFAKEIAEQTGVILDPVYR